MSEPAKKTSTINVIELVMREQRGAALAVGFVAGVLIGWLVLGWWLIPVEWKDAGPEQLHPDFQSQWVQMTSDSFILTTDSEVARMRLSWLGSQAAEYVEQTRLMTQGPDQLRVSQLQFALAEHLGNLQSTTSDNTTISEGLGQVEGEDASVSSGVNGKRAVLPAILGGVGVVIVMTVGGYFLVRHLGARPSVDGSLASQGGNQVDDPSVGNDDLQVAPTMDLDSSEGLVDRGNPVARFMTTYLLGDDLYDDSFSIDDVNGDFLGECGMGVSDTIGVGDPKKVCAFEIWLFDKNDVRTVTKVLMSEDAFSDDVKRVSLSPKGEPKLASLESTMVLETASLYVTSRVVDLQYGKGALPQNSFFHQLTIELSAWKKV